MVKKLTGGLEAAGEAAQGRGRTGHGRFVSPNVIEVMGNSGTERIRFDKCIIAVGSEAIRLPGLPSDPRIMDSTDALELPEFSGGLLVVGGGIIGLEMACVYDALGGRVSVVELTDQLIPGMRSRPGAAARKRSAGATSRFCWEPRSPRSSRSSRACA